MPANPLFALLRLKSTRFLLDPGSQLVCVLTQTLIIVTTARIFVANLRVALLRAPRSKDEHGKGHIPPAVSGISILCLWDIQLTFDWYIGFQEKWNLPLEAAKCAEFKGISVFLIG